MSRPRRWVLKFLMSKHEYRSLKVFLHEVCCQSVTHSPPALCADFPQGSGMGPSAAAELLEEDALSQGGEGRPADSAHAGEGRRASTQKDVTIKQQEVKRSSAAQDFLQQY